jgi:hypothetical protein
LEFGKSESGNQSSELRENPSERSPEAFTRSRDVVESRAHSEPPISSSAPSSAETWLSGLSPKMREPNNLPSSMAPKIANRRYPIAVQGTNSPKSLTQSWHLPHTTSYSRRPKPNTHPQQKKNLASATLSRPLSKLQKKLSATIKRSQFPKPREPRQSAKKPPSLQLRSPY